MVSVSNKRGDTRSASVPTTEPNAANGSNRKITSSATRKGDPVVSKA